MLCHSFLLILAVTSLQQSPLFLRCVIHHEVACLSRILESLTFLERGAYYSLQSPLLQRTVNTLSSAEYTNGPDDPSVLVRSFARLPFHFPSFHVFLCVIFLVRETTAELCFRFLFFFVAFLSTVCPFSLSSCLFLLRSLAH